MEVDTWIEIHFAESLSRVWNYFVLLSTDQQFGNIFVAKLKQLGEE